MSWVADVCYEVRTWAARKIAPDAIRAMPVDIILPDAPRQRAEAKFREKETAKKDAPLQIVEINVFADHFLKWLRDAGQYGYFTARDLDHELGVFADHANYALHPFGHVKSVMKTMAGVSCKFKRTLSDPELREIYERTGKDRLWLYRIASNMEMEKRQLKQGSIILSGNVTTKAGNVPAKRLSSSGKDTGSSPAHVRRKKKYQRSQLDEGLQQAA